MVAQAQAQSRPNAARFQEILRGLAQAAGEDLASARDAFIRNYLAASGRGEPLAEGQTDAEQRAAAGLSLGGLAGGGGLAVGRAAPGRGEAIGMFLGRRAKDPFAREIKKWKVGDPLPPGTVMGPDGRPKTATIKGPGNLSYMQPKIEISDAEAKLIYDKLERDKALTIDRKLIEGKEGIRHDTYNQSKLEDILSHEKLFQAYPFLRKMPFSGVNIEDVPRGVLGQYHRHAVGSIDGRITLRNNLTEKTFLNALLHEVQHAIQTKELYPRGFRGTSPEDELRAIDVPRRDLLLSQIRIPQSHPAISDIDELDDLARTYARLLYKRDAGEQEANAVIKRRSMTQDELARNPPQWAPTMSNEPLLQIGREMKQLQEQLRVQYPYLSEPIHILRFDPE